MITAQNITKSFGKNGHGEQALKGVSLDINPGDFATIVGRSGSGKSTLLNVLSTLLQPDNGELLYKGENLGAASGNRLNKLRGSDFAMIFQMHHLLPYLTAEENVLAPFMRGIKPISQLYKERAAACLERVGLGDKGQRLPGELSGGEQQRVAIARALVTNPDILFADEPTGSLDKNTGESVMQLLKELHRDGLTIVMVTHEPSYAAMGTRTIELEDGRIKNET